MSDVGRSEHTEFGITESMLDVTAESNLISEEIKVASKKVSQYSAGVFVLTEKVTRQQINFTFDLFDLHGVFVVSEEKLQEKCFLSILTFEPYD